MNEEKLFNLINTVYTKYNLPNKAKELVAQFTDNIQSGLNFLPASAFRTDDRSEWDLILDANIAFLDEYTDTFPGLEEAALKIGEECFEDAKSTFLALDRLNNYSLNQENSDEENLINEDKEQPAEENKEDVLPTSQEVSNSTVKDELEVKSESNSDSEDKIKLKSIDKKLAELQELQDSLKETLVTFRSLTKSIEEQSSEEKEERDKSSTEVEEEEVKETEVKEEDISDSVKNDVKTDEVQEDKQGNALEENNEDIKDKIVEDNATKDTEKESTEKPDKVLDENLDPIN